MNMIAAQIEREHPKETEGLGAAVVPMQRRHRGHRPHAALRAAWRGRRHAAHRLRESREPAAGARAGRQPRVVVRAALGAGRGRLVAQAIAELVPLLALGGAAGCAAAHWAIGRDRAAAAADVPRVENIGLNLPVLAFTAAALALTAPLRRRLAGAGGGALGLASARGAICSRGSTTAARRAAFATCSSWRRSRAVAARRSPPRCSCAASRAETGRSRLPPERVYHCTWPSRARSTAKTRRRGVLPRHPRARAAAARRASRRASSTACRSPAAHRPGLSSSNTPDPVESSGERRLPHGHAGLLPDARDPARCRAQVHRERFG